MTVIALLAEAWREYVEPVEVGLKQVLPQGQALWGLDAQTHQVQKPPAGARKGIPG